MNPTPLATDLSTADQYLLSGYDRLWRMVMPIFRHRGRLADGYAQRCLSDAMPRVDLWWQAASAGEAYLAIALSEALNPLRPTRLLVTTQTRQGYDILVQRAESLSHGPGPLRMWVRYLPFDRPTLMRRAVAQAQPRVAVLLETELWPGFMLALKEAGIPLVVINARMGAGSLRRYRLRPSLWRALRPQAVLALSKEDARRFGCLFGSGSVATMPNIKFDRLKATTAAPSQEMQALFAENSPLVVLGSVRRAEEPQIETLLVSLHQQHPHALLALFPRHMERLDHWQTALRRRNLPWVRRSMVSYDHPVLTNGGILLWDTFGELTAAYALACGAYVGGSLVPLGGQNFLEPLAQGIRPVIGPHWDNFAWVDRGLIDSGLVKEVANVDEAFQQLKAAIQMPPDDGDKAAVRAALDNYLAPRRGGSAQAAALIRSYLAQSGY
jgi:3-deoxy-D-manno-octulosonic-acid transferase